MDSTRAAGSGARIVPTEQVGENLVPDCYTTCGYVPVKKLWWSAAIRHLARGALLKCGLCGQQFPAAHAYPGPIQAATDPATAGRGHPPDKGRRGLIARRDSPRGSRKRHTDPEFGRIEGEQAGSASSGPGGVRARNRAALHVDCLVRAATAQRQYLQIPVVLGLRETHPQGAQQRESVTDYVWAWWWRERK